MKLLCLLLLSLGSLFAQIEPNEIYNVDLETIHEWTPGWTGYFEFTYEVKVVDMVKTLLWSVRACHYPPFWEQLSEANGAACPVLDGYYSLRELFRGKGRVCCILRSVSQWGRQL